MAQPSTYNRIYNFANYQAENPSTPLPANQVDAEFNRIKVIIDQIRASIAGIQRDDTALANATVGYDQLKAELDGFGFNPPSSWAPATNYVVRDTVFSSSGFYQCLVSHVSTADFQDDLDDEYWELIADFSEVAATTNASQLTSGTLADARLNFTITDFIKTLTAAADAAAARTVLSAPSSSEMTAADTAVVLLAAPPGVVADYAGASAPSGWLLCYGQAISRATYAALFSAVGTTYGSGDGSTTFNVPDLRGRVVAGQDDMGGSSANRLTNANDGLDGDTLGAAGGGETQTLVTANLPAYTPAGTITNGAIETTINNGTSVLRQSGGLTAQSGSSFAANSSTITASSSQAASTFAGTPQGGTSTAFGIVQPTIILNKIIKT